MKGKSVIREEKQAEYTVFPKNFSSTKSLPFTCIVMCMVSHLLSHCHYTLQSADCLSQGALALSLLFSNILCFIVSIIAANIKPSLAALSSSHSSGRVPRCSYRHVTTGGKSVGSQTGTVLGIGLQNS